MAPSLESLLAQPGQVLIPLAIPISHWQLRHYISHPEKDILYYASGRDVFYLNTVTHRHKQIATLPFEARCTASGHGYVCVAGEEDGHFAVIQLAESVADVDEPLPLDFSSASAGRALPPRAVGVEVMRIGDEIVNSISVHLIQDEEAHLYDLVAILTNNDRTVRIYSLQQGVETTVLNMPFAMNHATLSPDAKTLAAVGDKNCVFLFDRAMPETSPQIPKPHNRLNMNSVSWVPCTELDLFVPASNDPSHRGYFTTAWSPSGRLLAVGSEAGYITVIDTQLLRDLAPDDARHAIVAVIESSRPNINTHMCPGAIRCMVFSPDPWDLLIWAEDRGRVCIGDLRTGLLSRQTIELDLESEHLFRLDVDDLDINRRARPDTAITTAMPATESNNHHESQNRANWALQAANSAWQSADPSGSASRSAASSEPLLGGGASSRLVDEAFGRHDTGFHDDPTGLSAHEQQVLDSLRVTRQRLEARARGASVRSINYTTPSALHASRSPSDPDGGGGDNGDGTETDSFPALSRVHAITPSQGSRTFASEHEQGRRRQRRPQQISRSATVDNGGEEDEEEEAPRPGTVWHQLLRRRSIHLSPQPETAADTAVGERDAASSADESPWRTISEAMSVARGPLFEPRVVNAEASLGQAEQRLTLLEQQRQRVQALIEASAESSAALGRGTRYELLREATSAVRGLRVSYDLMSRRGLRESNRAEGVRTAGGGGGREFGVRTAGLAVSKDGRTVWAATEEGIFELTLRVEQRLLWSAIDYK